MFDLTADLYDLFYDAKGKDYAGEVGRNIAIGKRIADDRDVFDGPVMRHRPSARPLYYGRSLSSSAAAYLWTDPDRSVDEYASGLFVMKAMLTTTTMQPTAKNSKTASRFFIDAPECKKPQAPSRTARNGN